MQLKDLQIGDLIKFGKYKISVEDPEFIIWEVVGFNTYKDSNNPSIANHVVLRTKYCIDYLEISNYYSSINYTNMSLRQFLNASGSGWFTPLGGSSAPSYSSRDGFLTYFAPMEIDFMVGAVKVVDYIGNKSSDKIYLVPKTSDVATKNLSSQALQRVTPSLSDQPISYRLGYRSSNGWCLSNGSTDDDARNKYGLVPYTNLKTDISIDPILDSDGCYTLIGGAPSNITLDKTSITMKTGAMTKVTASVTPVGTAQDFIYTSSDPTICTVDNEGYVKALKPGNVTITVETSY